MILVRPACKIVNNPDWAGMLTAIGAETEVSPLEYQRFAVQIVCDRTTASRLIRHYASTRVVMGNRQPCDHIQDVRVLDHLTFVIPPGLPDLPCYDDTQIYTQNDRHSVDELLWLAAMRAAEKHYRTAINRFWPPEQILSILPGSLKANVVMTANLQQWRLIFRDQTNHRAHPQMRDLMIPLLDEVQGCLPGVFDDIAGPGQ